MNIPWGDIATFSTAALSAVATAGAWRAAHQSAKTADAVARIEQDRWQADLLPQFRITIDRPQGDCARLTVHLAGPVHLVRLDEICIQIHPSDDQSRVATLPTGVTQEDLDAQVWGPLRFTHGANGADIDGRTVAPFSLEVGKGHPFSLELTRPPHWQQGNNRIADWRNAWLNKPMRLVLTCTRHGFADWVVPYEVEVPHATRMRWLD